MGRKGSFEERTRAEGERVRGQAEAMRESERYDAVTLTAWRW
jgi:hypothetical protein